MGDLGSDRRTLGPAMSTPDLLASFDETRARRLRNMKRNAAGLLVLSALVFMATFAFSDGSGWCLPCGWVEPNERPYQAAIITRQPTI